MSDGVTPHPDDPSCACNVCGRLKDIEDQLRTAQALVVTLLRTRQLVAAQIGATHNQDLFRRVPNEVLSHIFEECGIAWSTPRLWTSIDIWLGNNSTLLNSTLDLVEEWLEWSGQLPLTIRVTATSMNASALQMIKMEMVIDIINNYAHRWQDLQLMVPLCLLQQIRSDSQGRSILRNLSIACSERPVQQFSFDPQNARLSPTVIRIKHWLRFVDIEWDNVTHVEVNFPLDECLEMLRRAPKILDCKLTTVFVDRSPAYPFPDHPIVHPNLKSLSIYTFQSPSPQLFHHLSLPSLRELRYNCGPKMSHDEEFVDFLVRSSSNLHILYLEAYDLQDSALTDILRTTTALTDLGLKSYGTVHHNLFQLLATSSLVAANDSNPFLPNLRRFNYRCFLIRSWDFLPKIFGPPSEIGKPHRRPLSMASVSSPQSSSVNPNIDEVTILQILELLHQGIQLEMSCKGEDILKASLKAHRLLPA
ncbi:hypothetical protein M413DRAFT_14612 [Hebeloma cylindrosporum]|uniref:F-box domain-containing protein n=1 Tax=Hebeloma cylindrosporum TaxID=76867 RepID=A0A0C3BTA6_HEBCY|nr:hypothetical protein M413DRAFT_14612 [Hebeloma cylindrosporum h7]